MVQTGLLQTPEAMIFDMDGTLFQTETLLERVHERVFRQLREEGLYVNDMPPVERLLGCLGMLLEDIWRSVMPDGSPEAHRRADELLLQYEMEGLADNQGVLYPHVEETLAQLKARGIKLFVASNGLEDYVKGIAKFRAIDRLFDGLYSAGEHGTATKVQLVALLLKEHGIDSAWMVGDRSSDVEAGKSNGLTVIGCDYAGFGKQDELKGSDAVIADFRQLIALLDSGK